MKIKIKTIEWGYPASREEVISEIWDLDLMLSSKEINAFGVLMILMGQGGLLEMSLTGDSEKTINFMRDLIGISDPYLVSKEEEETIWLYQPGYECYREIHPFDRPTFYFVNPIPDPNLG